MVEEPFGRVAEEVVGSVEGLNRGEAATRVGASRLLAGIGGGEVFWKAAADPLGCLGKLPLHHGGVVPGPVDQEEGHALVFDRKRRGIDREKEALVERRKGIGRVGEKPEI